jgi:SET domain-containing protein
MKDTTDEFSFILRPSEHGVGVFAAHPIKSGSYLRLFGDEKEREHRMRPLKQEEVPKVFSQYCVAREGYLSCPLDFGNMPVGWYLNHSKIPNAIHRDYHWYALRDIKEGEEILINYNSLEEPENSKEDYYK